MGLLREGINEVIATTHENAAPIGIINRKGRLQVVLFLGSHTAENVEKYGWLVANFTYDPVCYVKTAFEDLSSDYFAEVEVDGIPMHRLKDVEAWGAYRAEVLRRTDEAVIVELTPLKEEIVELNLHPVNRGFASIIDATVHATRYVRNRDPWLGRLIEHHAVLVKKCGGEREQEALELLKGYIRNESLEKQD